MAAVAAATGFGPGSEDADLDPAGQAQAFVAAFKRRFGDRHPRFMEVGWRAAGQAAAADHRFLLVYLHAPEHEVGGGGLDALFRPDSQYNR